MEYVTDRDQRCSICGGRMVLGIENEEVVSRSLEIRDGFLVCKDSLECEEIQRIHEKAKTIMNGLLLRKVSE